MSHYKYHGTCDENGISVLYVYLESVKWVLDYLFFMNSLVSSNDFLLDLQFLNSYKTKGFVNKSQHRLKGVFESLLPLEKV